MLKSLSKMEEKINPITKKKGALCSLLSTVRKFWSPFTHDLEVNISPYWHIIQFIICLCFFLDSGNASTCLECV